MVSEAAVDEVFREIRRLFREELSQDRLLFRELTLSDLQLDSVALVTLLVGLEDRFRIVLTSEDAADVKTLDDLARLIATRLQQKEMAVS